MGQRHFLLFRITEAVGVSSFNAQPKAPAQMSRAGAFGWALNESMKQLMSAITTKVALSKEDQGPKSGQVLWCRSAASDHRTPHNSAHTCRNPDDVPSPADEIIMLADIDSSDELEPQSQGICP